MSAPAPTRRFNRLLLTGAAGGLGRELRRRLPAHCATLRLSDLAPLAAAGAGEEVIQADLADAAAVLALLEGVEAVIHLGGGEPKNKAPQSAIAAATAYLSAGDVKYTPSAGTPSLRKAVADYTEQNYGRKVAVENIIVQ